MAFKTQHEPSHFKQASKHVVETDLPEQKPQGSLIETKLAAVATTEDAELDTLAELLRETDPFVAKVALEGAMELANEDADSQLAGSMRLFILVLKMKPRGTLETLLALQLVALHRATLRHAVAMDRSGTAHEIALFEGGLNKLARTFSILTDTFDRLRNGGQQTMRIERVTINEGGQAVVGLQARGEQK